MAKNLIYLKNLDLTYNLGASNAFKALHDVSVDIEDGDFAIILGPSGCGKSSLLNIVAGLELPENGTVMVKDKNLFKLKEKERVEYHRKEIGMIFQSYNLISTLNVLDNVALPQIFINKRKKERDKRSMQILERLGISEHAKKIPSELSGGQQQRIGIARSIVNDPQIILADEPVGNLDSASSNNVMEILSKLNTEEGKTVVMVTHNIEHASWGNRIIHMRDGKITKIEIKDREGSIKKENREDNLSTFDKFVDRFKGLSKKQIRMLIEPFKAKYLVEKLTTVFQENQLERMEQETQNRLASKTTKEDFYGKLDQDMKKGGAGLDSRRAKRFSEKVEGMLVLAAKVSKKTDSKLKATDIIKALIENRNYKIKQENFDRMVSLLAKKLDKEIEHKDFREFIGVSLKNGGAGIDSRIVEEIVEFVDLIQIISFGVDEKQ